MSRPSTLAADEARPPEVKISSPGRHWRGRSNTIPLAPPEAARQGDIARQAFLLLGKAEAIAFLNTENGLLGGRPIALATQSAAGHTVVQTELHRLSAGLAES